MSQEKTPFEREKKVLQQAKQFTLQFRGLQKIEDPEFHGWVHWAAMHLDSPSQTMKILSLSGTFAPMQRILSNFAMLASVYRADVKARRFTFLTTFNVLIDANRNIKKVNFDKDALHDNRYNNTRAFLMQVTVVAETGTSKTATIWIEDNQIEVFSPWYHTSQLLNKTLQGYILPFLRKKWLKADQKVSYFGYRGRSDLLQMGLNNYLNTYFIFLRSANTRAKCQMAFSEKSDLADLISKRDLVIQTCGRLIAGCAKLRDKSPEGVQYRRLFSADAGPFVLSRQVVTVDLANVMMPCTGSYDPLWSRLEDILPVMKNATASLSDMKWPVDTDKSKWKNFMEVMPSKKMEFLSPS